MPLEHTLINGKAESVWNWSVRGREWFELECVTQRLYGTGNREAESGVVVLESR